MMSDYTEYESAFIAGATQELKTVSVNGIEHSLIPPGCKVESFERLMPAPVRIVASPKFTAAADFAEYFKEFKEPGTRIFVDDSNHVFTTVFDCHHKGAPAWGDHSSSFAVLESSEWIRFVKNSDYKMNQRDFAEFLEDNLEYITGEEYSGLKLLELANNINIEFKGELKHEETIEKGLKTLVIKDESRAFGEDSAGKQIEFPTELEITLRVFKNSIPYKFKVRLRERIKKDGIVFWYTIADPEAIEEHAFNSIIDEIKELTGVAPLRGSYKGAYHK